MLVNLIDGIDIFGLQNVKPDNFNGILLSVDMVDRLIDFSKATLTNLIDILELLLKSASV